MRSCIVVYRHQKMFSESRILFCYFTNIDNSPCSQVQSATECVQRYGSDLATQVDPNTPHAVMPEHSAM